MTRGSARQKPRTSSSSIDGRHIPAMIGLTLAWRVAGAFTILEDGTNSEQPEV